MCVALEDVMADENSQSNSQQLAGPHPALNALQIMVGVWELSGRDFNTKEEIRGQSSFAWLEGGYFLVHRFQFEYSGRAFTGVEYIRDDETTGHFRTHVFSNQGADPLEYTWEVDENTFTNWFGDVGSDNYYKGVFSESGNHLAGQWTWPGGGYEATMIRVRPDTQ